MNKIGPRLVVWFTLLLVFSLIFVSTTVYYLLSTKLRENDQELLLRLASTYSKSIETLGIKSVTNNTSPEVFFLIFDNNGDKVFESKPHRLDGDFEDDEEIEEVLQKIQELSLSEGWSNILIKDDDKNFLKKYEENLRIYLWKKNWMSLLPLLDNDMVEVYTKKINSKFWLKIGKSSEDREEHLAYIRRLSLIVILPFILLGFLSSFLLARTILAPLKNLTQRVIRIQNGESNLRAQTNNLGDEVDTLSKHFNSLLEHNEKLIKNLKETLDNIAHDLRTPLTHFRMQAEMTLQSNNENSQKEILQNGLEHIEQITSILNAIMDISETESSTLKLNKESINIKSFILSLTELFEYVAEEKNISLHVNIPDFIKVNGDKARLSQAFSNLIDNAIKYSPNGSKIEILCKQEETNTITIKIKDQGQGISPEDIENIWDRLYRADKSRSTPGLGIGLSLVKAIITAHSGEVRVESTPQNGSSFFVKLPICNDSV